MKIVTARLVLKPFEEPDDGVLAGMLMDERVKKTYMVPDYETGEQYLTLAKRFRELSRSEDRFIAGVYEGARLVGFLNDVGIEDGVIELGYVIAPEFQNRGYASEALRGAIGWLFEKGYKSVRAGAFRENAASLRVMEKAGMRRLEFTEQIEYRGRTHQCLYCEIRAEG